MFHSRKLNNCINRIQEKALRLTYKDKMSTYQELLRLDNSVTIHHRNLQTLATEIFKWKNNLSPKIMDDNFKTKKTKYTLRNFTNMEVGSVKTTTYGTEIVRYRAPLTWKLVPDDFKESKTLCDFKNKIKLGYLTGVNVTYVNNTYTELVTYNLNHFIEYYQTKIKLFVK